MSTKRAGVVLLVASALATFVLVVVGANETWGLVLIGVFAGGLWLADRP